MKKALLFSIILLTGCAQTLVGREGPVTVILDTPETVQRHCKERLGEAGLGKYWRGCITIYSDQVGKSFEIWCTFNDAQCLAHEIRHAIEGPFH